MDSHFGLFGDSVSVIWILILVCLEVVLVSVQDRCTVCHKHTIALEIILDTSDNTPR
jgi:hypothetical protein